MFFSGTVKFREGLLTALLATLNTEHHNIRDGSIFLSLPRDPERHLHWSYPTYLLKMNIITNTQLKCKCGDMNFSSCFL